MATYRWEVPLTHYPRACALIADAHLYSEYGELDKLDLTVSELTRIPGYPHQRTQEDLVVVVPAGAKVWIANTQEEQV